jgi:hypothetical protein
MDRAHLDSPSHKPEALDWGKICERVAEQVAYEMRPRKVSVGGSEIDDLLYQFFVEFFDRSNEVRIDPHIV